MEVLTYRPNVCMIVYDRARRIFLGERLGEPGVWQLPQGGVEPGFSLEENVLKELEEEIGADRSLFSITHKLNATHRYEWDTPPNYAKGKWRGQEQTFWLVAYSGKDSDINLDGDEAEFSAFQWCPIDAVLKTVEAKRQTGYRAALAEAAVLLKF